METTLPSDTVNAAIATPATPFPASNDTDAAGRSSTPGNAREAQASTPADTAAAAPLADRLVRRAASSAHAAVDSVAARLSSLSEGLHGRASNVSDARDEWTESAREAIRQHPLATVAGALVIGAALVSLMSSRRH